MKFMKLIKEIQSEVKEAGFSSTAQMMRGLKPKIRTVVIITAENPCGVKLSPRENNSRNRDLEDFLSKSLYGYKPAKGQYMSKENSFIVNNMTKTMALKLGRQFEQDTIIFGERFEEDGNFGMKFQMIQSFKCNNSSEVGEVLGETKVFIGREDEEDLYTEVKGRRFQIPFFDVDDESGSTDYSKAYWDGGKIAGSVYMSKNISKKDDEKINEWIQDSLNENTTEKSQWTRRGMIINLLKKYISDDLNSFHK